MRDGKIEPRDKGFIVVRLQGHLPCPTPLPESPTREFSSLDQNLLYGGESLTHQITHHKIITPQSQL